MVIYHYECEKCGWMGEQKYLKESAVRQNIPCKTEGCNGLAHKIESDKGPLEKILS